MMKLAIRLVLFALMLSGAGVLFGQATAPATRPAPRSIHEIKTDLKLAHEHLDQIMKPPMSFFDPAGRQALAKTDVAKVVRQLSALNEERSAAGFIDAETATRLKRRDRLWLALIGDLKASEELRSAVDDSNKDVALAALSDLLLIAMSDHAADQVARLKDVAALEALVRANPQSPVFVFTLERIALSDLPRDVETRRRLMPVLRIQQMPEAKELAQQAQDLLTKAEPSASR